MRIGRKQVGGESLLTSPDGSESLSSLPILDLGGEVKDPPFQEQVPRASGGRAGQGQNGQSPGSPMASRWILVSFSSIKWKQENTLKADWLFIIPFFPQLVFSNKAICFFINIKIKNSVKI